MAVRITAGMADAVATPGTRAVGNLWNKDSIGVIVSRATDSNMPENYKNACYVTDSEGVTAAFTPKDEANTIYFDNDMNVLFKAYAPYQSSANPATLPGTNSVITIDATNQATSEEQEAIDFITVAEAAVATKSNPQVAFNGRDNTFKHIMSRLVLKIEIPEVDGVSSSAVERISSISLGGLCTGGTFNLNEFIRSGSDTPDTNRDTWKETWDISKYVKDETLNTDGTVVLRTHTLIFIPQQASSDKAGDNPRNAVPITITLDGQTYTNATAISGDEDNPGRFSSGRSYEYTIRLRQKDIEVAGATIQNWTAGGTGDVDATQQ